MGHYTGPKGRVNRRLSVAVYESAGSVRALQRRDTPPGVHTRRGKQSTYGLSLAEKQKLKHLYGLDERMLRRVFDRAKRTKGNTGAALLRLCERRIDNVICRSGITKTRAQARQGVVHGHFTVNGEKVTTPSFMVRAGDVVQVKNRENLVDLYRGQSDAGNRVTPVWLNTDHEQLKVTVGPNPGEGEASLAIDINLVIELLNR
jgi:small subunit ribosomal protein S4